MSKITEHKIMFLIYVLIASISYQFLDKSILHFGLTTFGVLGSYVRLNAIWKINGVIK